MKKVTIILIAMLAFCWQSSTQTCVPATFTLTNVPSNCPTNFFSIEVDVTDLGSASSVNVLIDGEVIQDNNFVLSDFPLILDMFSGGTDYDITIQNAPDFDCVATQTITTDVCPCVPAVTTGGLEQNCSIGLFLIELDVTEPGDGISITDGTDTFAIDPGPGPSQPFLFGGYAVGTSVTLTVQHSDPACNYDLGPYAATCPTVVPDDNFENYLETHDASGNVVAVGATNSMGNGIANDDFVETSRINTVTDLVVNGLGISDLTGIEDFAALTTLDCSDNILSSIDLSANTALTYLDCSSNNSLSSLDVSANTALTYLDCKFNSLEVIDLSLNTALTYLDCQNNFESSLEVLDLSLNTALTYLDCRNNFEIDNLILTANTALTYLDCDDLNLSNLDLSANTALTYLDCEDNNLSSLDVSLNTALAHLDAEDNFIISLDLSANPLLTYIECDNNLLTYLNVANGNNTIVTEFNCNDNPNLFCVQVDDVPYSVANWTQIDPTSSFSEDCGTFVPDDNFENYLETHDASGNVVAVGATNSMGNGIPNDNFVETSRVNAVTNLNVDNLNIEDLTGIEGFISLTGLSFFNNQVTDFTLAETVSLTSLNCGFNQLTAVDVTNFPNLTSLTISGNQIESIDVSQNPVLAGFGSDNNLLTLLDVSQNPVLDFLDCSNNQLTYLNVANGNNSNFVGFGSNGNPNLSCIKVDDVTYSNINWTNIDAASSFSLDCGITIVPDDIFENYLETHDAFDNAVPLGDPTSMGNGIANDNFVETSRINTVTVLDVQNLDIADLTGIEGFTALTSLECQFNNLTTLDISANTALTFLDCKLNSLPNLDVSANTALTYLNCTFNNFTDLDVSSNLALSQLYCGNNNLSSINVSSNLYLTALGCNSANLGTIDVSNNTALTFLACFNNNLTSLDLSTNIALTILSCGINNLESLDISLNTNITNFSCEENSLTYLNIANGNNINFTDYTFNNNPDLTCIEVDDTTYSNSVWGNGPIDPQTQYSTNCGEVTFSPFAYLQGALPEVSSGRGGLPPLMRDDLRVLDLIPLNSPYDNTALPDPNILNTGGINGTEPELQDIVDWVWVELRDDQNPSIVIDGQSALLQRDGSIISLDGTFNLTFTQPAKHYNVVVKHRNHSAIMSDTRQAFPRDDFQFFMGGPNNTLGATSQYEVQPGFYAMWAGDANTDGAIQFSGGASDVNVIKDFVIAHPTNPFGFLTATINGYSNSDINMDGAVKFSGSDNDSNVVKDLILSHPGNFLNVPTFTISTQVPEN